MNKNTLGIVMGRGDLPALLIEACKKKKRSYFLLPIEGQAEESFVKSHPHAWISFGQIKKTLDLLKENNIKELVFGGTVRRPSFFSMKLDRKGLQWLFSIGFKAFGDDGLLSGLTKFLEKEGLKIVGVPHIVKELLIPYGALGKIKPSAQDKESIQKGFIAAKELGKRDVGQGVVVENSILVAKENIEGTDAMIHLATERFQGKKEAILVKVSKPNQEERMDLPTIGPKTIEMLSRHGYKGVALEAGAGLILNQKQTVTLANEKGLFVYGVAHD
ncbi:UDP-2,3-diacylglucosamine diphosphatase LpxI [Alphaproteobacteria bacterium]|jgi:DUF1009 family protein|nr:UDP-2,3-diacylglucosamine diphosphatase LpxI [Alphaproteobacteria bacterium]